MTSKRYLGNIITDTPTAPAGPYENDAASGVWSLAEAETYTAAGLWPIAGNTVPIGLFAGGQTGSTPTVVNTIDQVTISTLGNATDFGDLTEAKAVGGGGGSSTRGLIGGGSNADGLASQTNVIETAQILVI